jgi:4-hydroxy-4-methyl-2-oxoglutarate aldolase
MSEKELTGKIARERIRMIELPPLPAGVLEGFRELGEITTAIADALDELGLKGALGSSQLQGSIPGACMVGRALTLRHVAHRESVMELARRGVNKMAEIEAHNLAEPGDVIVVQGVQGNSNMGGVGVQIGRRQGEVGAIVDGGVRDIAESRSIGYPIWASEFTPITGKWRVETVEINGPVEICGVPVNAGDLVVADSSGVCFVPREHAEHVLAFARKKAKSEQDSLARVRQGLSVPVLAGAKPRDK